MDTAETSRGLLDVDLVSASHLQTLLPAELLSQHIVHSNLSDIISTQAQDYATHHRLEGQYLQDQYEASDLLSHTELTEEESKLAAAIVAAQLAQQQKHQCIQEGVIVNAKNDTVSSLSQLTHSPHSSVIESLSSSHNIPQDAIQSSAMDEYDAQELIENDLVDTSTKLFNSINNHIRLPPLKKFPHSLRNIPLSRYNIVSSHELGDSHTISSIVSSNGVVQNSNLHSNVPSIRTSYANDVNTNSIELQSKLLMHNSTLDLTLQANGISRLAESINDSLHTNSANGNGIHSNIMNTSDSNILTNSSHEHIHIVNAGTLVNSSGKSVKKSQNAIHLNGNSMNSNLNGTIVKEELEFDIKNIKCDEEDVQTMNDQLNVMNNSRYAVSDSDGSDVPTKRTRQSSNYAASSNNTTSSSRSLPHKKRISRRLKTNNIKKSTNVSSNANSAGTNISTTAGGNSARNTKKPANATRNPCVFYCQLCGEKFEAQLNFYKHLKLHYDPPEEKHILDKFSPEQPQYIDVNEMVNHQHIDSPLLRATLSEPHTILPNLDEDSLHTDNMSAVQDSCNSMNSLSSTPNDTERQHENRLLQAQHNINLDSLPNLVISGVSSLRCKFCSMSFKRHSALEGHMRDTHFKDDLQDEFSEPEDLMEGIRSVVEASGGHCSDDDDDMKMNMIPIDKNHRDWYPADELRATEVDLQEIEAEQSGRGREDYAGEGGSEQGREGGESGERGDEAGGQQHEPQQHHHQQHQQQEDQLHQHQQQEHQHHQQQQEHQQPVEENAGALLEPCSFICGLCGDTFDSREQYNEHEADCQLLMCESDLECSETKSTTKPSGPKLNCLQCDRQFNHRNSLMYHIQSHSEQRPYQCEVCGNSFFATSALKVHMRRHSGDKPYQCMICAKYFRQWSDLKYHMVSIHSDVRQYQCEFCGKDFARKYSLIVHRRIHTGEKNYKCEFCGKTFRASSYLQNHRRIHTGEKPYPCEICGKPFRVRGDMKRHMSTHARDRTMNGIPGKVPLMVPKKEESNADESNKKFIKTEINTNSLPKISEVSGTHKLLHFTSDDSNTSSAKLQIPKLECVGSGNSNYMEDQQEIRKSIEMQGSSMCSDTILADESLDSPAQPMNLNIASSNSTSKGSSKDCSLELQVQVSSNSSSQQNSNLSDMAASSSDQTLHRYSRSIESTENGKDGSTVYLWPVYMT